MTKTYLIKALTIISSVLLITTANANSVTIGSEFIPDNNGQITVEVEYDFTDFPMFGGGVDLFYDPAVLQFESYERADLSGSQAQDIASPIGSLVEPGSYIGFGIGTFEFFNGMTDAGTIGTFVFTILNFDNTGALQCAPGEVICLRPNDLNPMVSLAGEDVSAEIFDIVVPIPGAVWLLLSGIGMLGVVRRKK